MKRMWQLALLVPLCLLLGGVVTLALFSLLATRPNNLGARDGGLTPCPRTPNCVCSQTPPEDAEHYLEPLAFDGTPAEAMQQLKKTLAMFPRVRIVTETDVYLYAEFTSLVFRFVDDVEFVVDAATRRIHMRSASRAGRSDLGVNRKRLEAFRQAFAAGKQ